MAARSTRTGTPTTTRCGSASPNPQNWIIGSDGRIAYVANIYDPEAIRAVLDAELE
jgi:hypothetical protein